MGDDKPLKSAYELAMERLRKADAEAGIEERRLTDEERTALADLRNFYDAKLAEREVLHQSALRKTLDHEARAAIEEEYQRDRERLTSERDSKLDILRQGSS
jgi:hypothetical protein